MKTSVMHLFSFDTKLICPQTQFGMEINWRIRNICKGIVIGIFEVCLHQRRKLEN